MKGWHWVLLVLVVAAGGTAGWWFWLRPAAAPQEAMSQVRAVPVALGAIEVVVSGSGTFVPAVDVGVTADAAGTTRGKVVKVLKEGTRVKAGDPVVWLDDKELRQAMEDAERTVASAALQKQQTEINLQAQASQATQALAAAEAAVKTAAMDLDAAKRKLERSKGLFEAEAIPLADLQADQQAVDKAQVNHDNALQKVADLKETQKITAVQNELNLKQMDFAISKAATDLDRAKENLANVIVHAPVAGSVGTVNVDVGQVVAGETVLLNIVDTARLRITLQVDEVNINKVEAGMPVNLSLEAFPDRTLSGKVIEIASGAEMQNNIAIFNVDVEVPNEDGQIRPGMTGEGDIVVAQEKDVSVIPLAAVHRQRGAISVTVLENGQPRQVPVTLGLDDGVNVAVRAGLQPGAEIVIARPQGNSGSTQGAGAAQSRAPQGGALPFMGLPGGMGRGR